jgi:hypothetical protein
MARRKRRTGRKPTLKAKKAYYKLIVKSYKRLKKVMQKHHPDEV